MIGPWIFIPPFMGLLEDNYEESIPKEILQNKDDGKNEAKDKKPRDVTKRTS